jgi:hypothetical protein
LRAVTGMRTRSKPKPALLNREAERAALDGLLGDLRSGRGRALVVRGEAGVGKSALLEYLVGAAAGVQVARAVGVESEMELAFAGLHLLCAPLLDRREGLPGPQRDALGVAFGLREGAAPDRFLVGLAVLTLPHRLSARSRPRAPAVRRVAAPRAPPGRGAGAAAHRARHVRRDRHAGVRRAGPPRTAGHRRDRPQAHRRHAQ